MSSEAKHILTLTDRQQLNVSGVTDVDEFNEQEIVAVLEGERLHIKGEGLHIDELSVESGEMSVGGKIISLVYSEKLSNNSLIKRLFGG